MRIVSQFGDDFNYDNITLIPKRKTICARENGVTITIAIYENRKRALQVMAEIRNFYEGAPVYIKESDIFTKEQIREINKDVMIAHTLGEIKPLKNRVYYMPEK